MSCSAAITEREIKIASVLRPLGNGPLTREQALLAAQLLDVHWAHVYRLRRRFLAGPVTSSLAIHKTGRRAVHRLDPGVEAIVQIALHQWMPQQIHLAHPLLDLCNEVGQRCTDADLPQPSRNTVAERWALYCDEQQALLANDPKSQKAPGNFNVKSVLDIVQIDHTEADAVIIEPWCQR